MQMGGRPSMCVCVCWCVRVCNAHPCCNQPPRAEPSNKHVGCTPNPFVILMQVASHLSAEEARETPQGWGGQAVSDSRPGAPSSLDQERVLPPGPALYSTRIEVWAFG